MDRSWYDSAFDECDDVLDNLMDHLTSLSSQLDRALLPRQDLPGLNRTLLPSQDLPGLNRTLLPSQDLPGLRRAGVSAPPPTTAAAAETITTALAEALAVGRMAGTSRGRTTSAGGAGGAGRSQTGTGAGAGTGTGTGTRTGRATRSGTGTGTGSGRGRGRRSGTGTGQGAGEPAASTLVGAKGGRRGALAPTAPCPLQSSAGADVVATRGMEQEKKRRRVAARPHVSSIQDLPDEILVEVLRCVSSKAARHARALKRDIRMTSPMPGYLRSTFDHALVCRRWSQLSIAAQASVLTGTRKGVTQARLFADLSRFHNLRHLCVAASPGRPVTDLAVGAITSSFPKLKKLVLRQKHMSGREGDECPMLTAVSGEGFASLLACNSDLQHLSIDRVPSLPDNPTECLNLKHLYLDSIFDIKPLAFQGMQALRTLKLNSRSATVPASLGSLGSLTDLSLDLEEATQLPEELGQLKRLRVLSLVSYELTSLPQSLSALSALEHLTIDCMNVHVLPVLPPNIHKLDAICSEECSPSPILLLKKLKNLTLRHSLFEQPGEWGRLSSVEELFIAGNEDWFDDRFHYLERDIDAGICKMAGVRSLRVQGLCVLPDSLPSMASIQTLELDQVGEDALPRLGRLSSLTALRVTNCACLKALPRSLTLLTGLQELELSRCRDLTVYPAKLGHLRQLRVLRIDTVRMTKNPSALAHLTNLEVLHLGHTLTRKLPPSMGRLRRLRELSLVGLKYLQSMPRSLLMVTTLKVLKISRCPPLSFPRGRGVHVFGGHPGICRGYLLGILDEANYQFEKDRRMERKSEDREPWLGKCYCCIAVPCDA